MMSSPVQGLKIKIKRTFGAAGTDNNPSQVPTGNDFAHQQPAASAEPLTVRLFYSESLTYPPTVERSCGSHVAQDASSSRAPGVDQ
jgi:hypothetical protein